MMSKACQVRQACCLLSALGFFESIEHLKDRVWADAAGVIA